MPSWSEIQDELYQVQPAKRGDFVAERTHEYTARIAKLYDRNVLYYASAFLQKPQVPGIFTSLNLEDLNGLMAGVRDQDFYKGLLSILHTPGGSHRSRTNYCGLPPEQV